MLINIHRILSTDIFTFIVFINKYKKYRRKINNNQNIYTHNNHNFLSNKFFLKTKK